jgi:hypothetical protein
MHPTRAAFPATRTAAPMRHMLLPLGTATHHAGMLVIRERKAPSIPGWLVLEEREQRRLVLTNSLTYGLGDHSAGCIDCQLFPLGFEANPVGLQYIDEFHYSH